MQERDKEFAKAIDEIAKGIEKAFKSQKKGQSLFGSKHKKK